MKTFTLFWLTGDSELVEGSDIAHAMNKAGYGNGSLRALDFHGEGDLQDKYVWDSTARKWNMTPEYQKEVFGK